MAGIRTQSLTITPAVLKLIAEIDARIVIRTEQAEHFRRGWIHILLANCWQVN